MLTKKQLEDAFNCWFGSCEKCSCNGLQREHGTFDCMVETIKTALAYRTMLEQLTEEIRDCFDNGVVQGRLINSLEKKLNEAEALLKESEVEK